MFYYKIHYPKLSSRQILKTSLSHVMLKVNFVQFISVNTSGISCFFKLLYSFFVFSKLPTSARCNFQAALNTFQAWIYFLLIKTCLLFHSFYIFKTKYHVTQEFYLEVSQFLSYLMNLLNDFLIFYKSQYFTITHSTFW